VELIYENGFSAFSSTWNRYLPNFRSHSDGISVIYEVHVRCSSLNGLAGTAKLTHVAVSCGACFIYALKPDHGVAGGRLRSDAITADLHSKTLIGLKRLIEVVRDSGGMLSVVLAGHPKLKNDLRRSSMEEIGSRATILELEGLGSEKRKYLKWLLAQSVPPKTKIESVITDVAISAVASLFLCWLVYYHAPADVTGTHLLFLPALNALSAIALVTGFCFIRARHVSEHPAAMFTAFVFSSSPTSPITPSTATCAFKARGRFVTSTSHCSSRTSVSRYKPSCFRQGARSQA
jgi:hypothetical protein